ncbi:Creatinase/aminopeptidase [Clavulina sp. PMI_390]|nr:Creatinase/aminopeptidase [Clavulina sp. PMI_390]
MEEEDEVTSIDSERDSGQTHHSHTTKHPPRSSIMDQFPAKDHVAKTIKALMALVTPQEAAQPHLIYLQGEATPYRHDTDRELAFRQESNFFYLTGCNVANSCFMIAVPSLENISAEHFATTLMIPKEDPLETMWSPPPPTLQAAKGSHPSISKIDYTESLTDNLAAVLKQFPNAIVHTLPDEPSSPFPRLTSAFTEVSKNHTSKYLLSAIHQARLIKTSFEIELIRKANAISSRAHETIMRLLGKYAKEDILAGADEGKLVLPGEWRIEREAEGEAVFVAACRREGALHQAYLPIVAGAERASTLHYCCGNEVFAWGPLENGHVDHDLTHGHGHTHTHAGSGKRLVPQVLLLDAGCEWNNYASDITRTTPVGNGGKFTKEAREIYSLVLKMQNESTAMLKPGLHWDDVQYFCHVTLVKEFLRLGIFVGDEQEVLDSQISAAFFPHGLGHSLGLDVHDVPSASKPPEAENKTIPALSKKHPSFYTYLRLRLPLQTGMVLTVEPGIYFSPNLLAPHRSSKYINHAILKQYESVGGVRIEDVVTITVDGVENLTTVGKEVEWLEAVASGEL